MHNLTQRSQMNTPGPAIKRATSGLDRLRFRERLAGQKEATRVPENPVRRQRLENLCDCLSSEPSMRQDHCVFDDLQYVNIDIYWEHAP